MYFSTGWRGGEFGVAMDRNQDVQRGLLDRAKPCGSTG
jgi:hypothetical protein